MNGAAIGAQAGPVAQRVLDAPVLACLLSTRRGAWTRAEASRALCWAVHRVAAAARELRVRGAIEADALAVVPGWQLRVFAVPQVAGEAPAPAVAGGAPAGAMRLSGLAEMAALHAASRRRELSGEESERLGVLVLREQAQAAQRPARIAAMRAAKALLEELEVAEHGAVREADAGVVTIEQRAEAA